VSNNMLSCLCVSVVWSLVPYLVFVSFFMVLYLRMFMSVVEIVFRSEMHQNKVFFYFFKNYF